ncbi:MAG: RuBisCO large subunit C-terminal-like domain-containing protein [Candidatus Bathyarchaeia archaeon]
MEREYTYDPYAFSIFEGIDQEAFLIAAYRIESSGNREASKVAEALAAEATTGTWLRVPTETDEIRERSQGKVLGVYEFPAEGDSRKFLALVAHPLANFGDGMPITMVMTGIAGNIYSMGLASVRLVDLFMPKSFLREFKGPKFGIGGLRDLLRVGDRPLVGAIMKPKLGMAPREVAKVCYEAAAGGADLIKDDEMQSNPPYCKREDRLSAAMEAIDRGCQESGKKCLYALNITDEVSRMPEIAEWAVQAGANCLLINYVTAGYSILRAIAEDPSIKVPILAHPAMARAFMRPERLGMNYSVIKKLVRICGADLTVLSTPYGKMYQPVSEYFWSVRALRDPLHGIKAAMPALGGAVYPGLAMQHVNDLGIDFMMIAGGGILGHPMGTKAGVRAMVQASIAAAKGIGLEEYARDHEELRAAIEKWGVYERPREAVFKPK